MKIPQRHVSTALPYFSLARCTAMPYMSHVHTVVETKAFIAAAQGTGMSEEEMQAVVDAVAADPTAGAIMQGCGGARKFRYAKPGRGKSGSYRIVSYYGGENIPVFLITVFGKGEKSNLPTRRRMRSRG